MAKKVRDDRKESVERKIELLTTEKYISIRNTIEKYKLKNMITHLCKITNVSRFGYYKYFSIETKNRRDKNNANDEILRDNVLKSFNFKNQKKGARQIKMILQSEFGINYNLKRIRRIMKKFNIFCPIRNANAHRRMMKATKEHTVMPNLLNREFKQGIPGKVLLTDITYLTYGENNRGYLSSIKDASTNEILAHHVSTSLKLDIVLDTLKTLKSNPDFKQHSEAFIHSDQGVHYTSPRFQIEVKKLGLSQSMSRRGNCWDNAPQESFFGHFKDEVDFKSCRNIDDDKDEIDNYMDYYNNHRYQWNLNKMTPVKYRNHLIAS